MELMHVACRSKQIKKTSTHSVHHWLNSAKFTSMTLSVQHIEHTGQCCAVHGFILCVTWHDPPIHTIHGSTRPMGQSTRPMDIPSQLWIRCSICDVSPAAVGKLEVAGKTRRCGKLSACPRGCGFPAGVKRFQCTPRITCISRRVQI